MEATTFCYLLSSLIQVFGALIALDLFILIIRYQDILNRLDLAAFQLGKILAMVEDTRGIIVHDNRDKYEVEALLFQSLDLKLRDKKIMDCIDKFNHLKEERKQERSNGNAAAGQVLQKIEETEREIVNKKSHYLRLSNEMESIPMLAIKFMVLPAVTLIAFSILLIHADLFSKEILYATAWGSVFASSIALFMLIKWARKLFL